MFALTVTSIRSQSQLPMLDAVLRDLLVRPGRIYTRSVEPWDASRGLNMSLTQSPLEKFLSGPLNEPRSPILVLYCE
jgi:hypothetical protein